MKCRNLSWTLGGKGLAAAVEAPVVRNPSGSSFLRGRKAAWRRRLLAGQVPGDPLLSCPQQPWSAPPAGLSDAFQPEWGGEDREGGNGGCG